MPRKDKKTLYVNQPKQKLITSVTAANSSQKTLLQTIANVDNSIILVSGIAGVGKTFCSMSWGIEQFMKGKFDKLILSRPAVEAGEHLGYLKGDFSEKINVFMLPLFDVLIEYFTPADIKKLTEENKIITLPLAFMRGLSFKHAFVMLDEAQNTTIKQMHLFVTRIGEGSKVVIAGDPKQSDLGPNNGFVDALERLQGVKGLEIVRFDPKHVVRHSIISSIDERYCPENYTEDASKQ